MTACSECGKVNCSWAGLLYGGTAGFDGRLCVKAVRATPPAARAVGGYATLHADVVAPFGVQVLHSLADGESMRALLALLLSTTACAVPTFDYIDGEDARLIVGIQGYSILEVDNLPVVGLTDCIDKVVWAREGAWLEGILMHEVIHVKQAETMGCGRFLAKYSVDPGSLERPAYLNEYLALGCDSDVTVAAAVHFGLALTPELCE